MKTRLVPTASFVLVLALALPASLAVCGPPAPPATFEERLAEAERLWKDCLESESDLVRLEWERDISTSPTESKPIARQAEQARKRREPPFLREQDIVRRVLEDVAPAIAKNPDDLKLIMIRARASDMLVPSEKGPQTEDPNPRTLKDTEAILKARPGDATALVVRATALRRLGRYGEARRTAREVLTADPQNARALAEDGLLAYCLDDFDAAIASLNAALKQLHRLPSAVRIEVGRRRLEADVRKGHWEEELARRKRDETANLPRVKISTSRGDIILELFEDDAPNLVNNFVYLVDRGFYDGTLFDNVYPGLLAMGGDPNTRPGARRGMDPGLLVLSPELPEGKFRRHFRGSLAMTPPPSSRSSKVTSLFYITLMNLRPNDGSRTVIGRVVEGMDVVEQIQPKDVFRSATMLSRRDHPYRPEHK